MLKRFIRWLFAEQPAPAAPAAKEPAGEPRESFFSTDISIDDAVPRATRWANFVNLAIPKTVADSYVLAGDGKTLKSFGMDGGAGTNSLKAAFAINQVGMPEAQAFWYGSHGFIGYQMCAIMAQHWLIYKACNIPARDALRKGYKFTVNDGTEIKPDMLAALEKANKRYRLNRTLVQYVTKGRIFGIRVALFKVDSQDPEYYAKPFNPDSITPGSYRGIVQVDPYWCVPELTSAAAMDPASLDFYEPTYWVINNTRYHKSHLVIMKGDEVADILKPSYLYGGVSVPQKIFERVYASERTANEAPQLALSKRAIVFYTDAAKAIANQGKFEEKLSIWARFRDNFGVKVADKDADKVEQHDTSLADLDAVIMTQYQIVAAVANVPVTKLMGTTPKGFNSSGDYESDSYHEELESIQANDMEPLIDRHMVCVIRSDIVPRFGGQPFSVDCTWTPVDTLSAKEQAEVNKLKAETYKVLVADTGAVDGDEVREVLAADEHSGFNGIGPRVNEDPTPDGNEEIPADGQA